MVKHRSILINSCIPLTAGDGYDYIAMNVIVNQIMNILHYLCILRWSGGGGEYVHKDNVVLFVPPVVKKMK